MKKIEYKVIGMTCSGCENSIKRVLSRVDGVESVEADHIKKRVIVSAQDHLEEDIVVEKVTKLGFQAEVLSS